MHGDAPQSQNRNIPQPLRLPILDEARVPLMVESYEVAIVGAARRRGHATTLLLLVGWGLAGWGGQGKADNVDEEAVH